MAIVRKQMLEHLAAKATEYAAGSALVGATFTHAQDATIATLAFVVAAPAMVYCRWLVEQH